MTILSRTQRGFSLVELLVGLVVGLIAAGAIIQTFSTFEAQKRSTVAGSEAQENGLVALSLIEQDVHNAGIGIADPTVLGCSAANTFTYTSLSGGPIPNFSLAPLIVTPGATVTQSDAIQVTSGDTLGALPSYTTQPMSSPHDSLTVSRLDNFAVGDLVLVAQAGNCTLMQVTVVQTSQTRLLHNPSGIYNPTPPNEAGWPSYATGAKVLNPKTIVSNSYQVTSGNLQMTSSTSGATPTVQAFSLVRNLVFMKAQYGVASVSGSQSVDTWINPTSTFWDPTSLAADPNSRMKIKAVRIAVVARSDKREAGLVTTPCTNVSLTVNQGPCAWVDTAASPAPVIDLSADPDWQHYRYKVYQTIVPLRNVIWDNV